MIALLQRDLRLALRAGGGFGLGLAFFLMVAVLVPLGVGPEGALLARIAPGILWVGALLACLLSLDRMFALDFEDGALDLMAVSPLPLEGVVAMKALAHWLVTGLPLVLIAPVLGVLLSLAPGGVYLASGLAFSWHARFVTDWWVWGGFDGGAKAGRVDLVFDRAAHVCAKPDLWGRSRAAGRCGGGCLGAVAAAGGHQSWVGGDLALCCCGGVKGQSEVMG